MHNTSVGSLEYLTLLGTLDPRLGRHLRRSLSTSYQEFISNLHEDFDDACFMLQERHDQYCDKLEDLITSVLVISLRSMGYDASHDTKVGGHVDIVVRGKDPSYLWIAEAKRDTSLGWIAEGFNQLCNRYATGNPLQDQAALVVYCQQGDAFGTLQSWSQKLAEQGLEQFSAWSHLPRKNLDFFSKHKLASSGTPITIRHMVINLKYK